MALLGRTTSGSVGISGNIKKAIYIFITRYVSSVSLKNYKKDKQNILFIINYICDIIQK